MTSVRGAVLVTGAGRRVGRAIAVGLAARGYDVAVHYHASDAGALETAELCRAHGVRAECFGADLSRADTPAPLVQRVLTAFGGLHALVNSAGIMLTTPLDAVAVADWDREFAINVRAPFYLSVAARDVLNEGGSIVNIADHLADDAPANLVPHGISKGAVVSLTHHLARQFAPRVRVNAVSPGGVMPSDDWPAAARDRFVDETPLKRLGDARDVAGAVAYLLEAPYVTGHTLVVDGGRLIR